MTWRHVLSKVMAPVSGPTVLLVDDEPEILQALRSGLARGFPEARVLTASSGLEGLRILADEPVDVILSDQKMPTMEGVEFLVRSRKLAPNAARMMLTAYAEQQLLLRNVNEAHICHFFTKPYALTEVVRVIRLAATERQRRAEEARTLARGIDAARQAVVQSDGAI